MGLCDRAKGTCRCAEGFVGSACERLGCANDCSRRGRCTSMAKRARFARSAASERIAYSDVWDAELIQGCMCDQGFAGYDCSERVCPDGDDPLTLGQRNEVQLLRCLATSGAFALFFEGRPTAWIPSSASSEQLADALAAHPAIGAATVTFSPGHVSVCSSTKNVVSIEFTQNFGPLAPLVAEMDATMAGAGGSSIDVSADGHLALDDSLGASYVSVKGDKEASECSGRGLCDRATGQCQCFQSFGDVYASSDGRGGPGGRGDCGWVRSSSQAVVSSCPGDAQCSGRGICNGTALASGGDGSYTCVCAKGFGAGDCSERVCPSGASWFDYPSAPNAAHASSAPCSDMGLCDRATGRCSCREGFFGAACEYLNCPWDARGRCSGHGRCLSMAQLANAATLNGEAAGQTYGADPNLAATWDRDRVLGCLCDDGFAGYDCSLRLCPSGDDPATYGDRAETQLLVCRATDGHFRLAFRGSSSAPVPHNCTADQLRDILRAVPSLSGRADVYFSLDGPPPAAAFSVIAPTPAPPAPAYPALTAVCNATGAQVVVVHFRALSGGLPPLRPDSLRLRDAVNGDGDDGSGSVRVFVAGESFGGFTSARGTTENDVCNGRGLCGGLDGRCRCFEDWGSGDGAGGVGGRGDCGYRRDDANPRELVAT